MSIGISWLRGSIVAGSLLLGSALALAQENQPERAPAPEAAGEAPAANPLDEIRNIETTGLVLHYADFYDVWEESDGTRVHMILGNAKITIGPFDVRAENLVVWDKPDAAAPEPAPETASESSTTARLLGLSFYAEGNVFVSRDAEYLKGDAIYYDLDADEGVIVNGSLKVLERTTGVFLYVRGDTIRGRQLTDATKRKLEGEGVSITTSSHGKPFWSFRVKHADFDASRGAHKELRTRGATLRLFEVPIAFFPSWSKSVDDPVLRGLRAGNSGEMGAFVQTEWGKRLWPWLDFTVEQDYYCKRGYAAGADLAWKSDNWVGFVDTYVLPSDHGEDFKRVPLVREERGRVHVQHRQRLPWDIRLDAELSYLSDRDFLEEYFEREARESKPQESYVYLRKRHENLAAGILYKSRVNPFQNEVDYLPGGEGYVFGQPLWETGAYWDFEGHLAKLRYRSDEDDPYVSQEALRAHARNTISRPFRLHNSVILTPWVGLDSTAYDDSPDGDDVNRQTGMAGVTLTGTWWKVYEYQNDLLQISGLRHIVQPELRYTGVFGSTHDPDEVFAFERLLFPTHLGGRHKPYDVTRLQEIDVLPEGDFARVSVRNRLQTKRPAGGTSSVTRDGVKLATVDLLDFELAFGYQHDKDKSGIDEYAAVEYKFMFAPRDKMKINSELELNTRTGHVDRYNVGLRWTVTEKDQIYVGHRYARDDISTLSAVWAHNWSVKWGTEVYFDYDFETRGVLNSGVIFRRNFEDFIIELGVDVDSGDDDVTFAVQLVLPFQRAAREDFFARYAFRDKTRE